MTYICAKQLANITMNQESTEYIVLYFLVLVGTLVVGVLARQFVLSKGVDNFSSIVAFFTTVIVLMAIMPAYRLHIPEHTRSLSGSL